MTHVDADDPPGIGAGSLSTPAAMLEVPAPDLAPIPPDRPATRADVPTVEAGDPLVTVDDDLPCLNCYRALGWAGTVDRTWLRAPVAERLVAADATLPAGFGLAVFDGWRSPETVRALHDAFYGPGSTLAPGYLADPDGGATPPHTTGGAVDVTLTWRGTPLSLGTPFDEFTERAHLRHLEPDGPEPDRSLRRLLRHTLVDAGFTTFWAEWWHVSWGDADWAADHGEPAARFGPTEPPV